MDEPVFIAPYKHIFRHSQVWAQRDFLIHGADADILGFLRGFYGNVIANAIQADVTGILFLYAGQHLNQGGFPSAVFPHQGMNFSLAECEIHIDESAHAGECLVDVAHGQDNFVLHRRFLLQSIASLFAASGLCPGYQYAVWITRKSST